MIEYKKLTTIDFETIGDEFQLDRIAIYSENFQEIFYNYETFFEFVVKNKIKKMFAHFGGGFDFLLILDYFRINKNFKLVSVIEVNGLFLHIKVRYFGWEFELQDSYFLVRCSLDEFAQAMEVGEKLDVDASHIESYDEKTRNEYVMNDAKILHDAIQEFQNILGFLEITISRIALLDFVKRFSQHEMKYRYPKDFILNIQPYYFGGHVDVYKRYGENLFYYDINSCYGYAMRECGAIYDYVMFVDKFKDTETEKGLYNIIVEKDLNIPVIPVRFREKNYEKIYFLNTRRELQATSLDIELLEQLNIPYKVLNGYLFKYDSEFFKEYVDYWYKMRIESKKMKFVAKLMINSLYGKFGQKIERMSTVISGKLQENQYYDKELNLGRKEIVTINWFSKPEIAAWITSGARFFHSKLLNKYQENLFYCDTDSLIVDREMNKDEIGTEIGKVKLETTKIDRAYFLGAKFYGLFNDAIPLKYKIDKKKKKIPIYKSIILKGFENKDFSESQFRNAIAYNDFKFEFEKNTIQKFKRSLISFDKYIKYTKVSKKINEVSLKRKLLPDKINTVPYNLTKNNILK